MTYSVKLSPPAAKAYKKLDPSVKPRLLAALDALQRQPMAGPQITRLKGRLREHLRCRASDYRIVYPVVQHERTVYVEYLQHRKDVYRHRE